MKLLFDANLSPDLIRRLVDCYPGSEHVLLVGMGPSPTDETIWAHASASDLVIVSKDADFYRLSTVHGPPPKVVWLRIGNGPTIDAETILRQEHGRISKFVVDTAAALLILGRRR